MEIRESEKRIEFPNGGFLEVKSAHGDDRLRGPTLDGVVVDEAAFMAEEKWTKELRATLSVRKGWALFLSTFDGENYFHGLYERGLEDSAPDWQSWRHPSIDNPYIDEVEIEEARRELTEEVFAQEYEADPISYSGAVFKGLLVQAAVDRSPVYRDDLPSYAGLDFGYTNPTALVVCQEDAEGGVSWIDETLWTATELNIRCEAIALECEKYDVRMIAADAAGATEIRTLSETLARRGLQTTVQPVPFGRWKDTGIDTRRWYLERGMEAIGTKCKTFTGDSKRYRYDERGEKVVKEADHTVDAATAFYATRAGRMVRGAA